MAQNEFYSGSTQLQFLAAISSSLGGMGLGTALAWTSPALPSIKNDTKFAYLNDDVGQASFLGSIVPIGATCACFVTGFLIGKLGRKMTMLLTAPPFVFGWLLIAFAQNYEMLVTGRFITGFCGGSFSLAAPVYIGEIAEPKLRGMLGSGFQLMIVIGIVFSYVIGYFLPWNWLSFVCAFVPAIFAGCMFVMPESPRYYIIKGKTLEATQSLMKFRGATEESSVASELSAITDGVTEAMGNQASIRDLLHPTILKPTSLLLCLMFFQQLSGVPAVIFYQSSIFGDAGSTLDGNVSAIIVGVVQLLATFAATLLVDRLGRKVLLGISDALMGLSLVALGVFFYLKDDKMDPIYMEIGWLPLVSLIIFMIAFSLGFGPIPWMMVGEILPARALGLASTIATVFNWFLDFLVTQYYESVKSEIGGSWCFWIFASICGIGTLFVVLILPETKGKSLDEIQSLFGSFERQPLRNYEGTSDPGYSSNEGNFHNKNISTSKL